MNQSETTSAAGGGEKPHPSWFTLAKLARSADKSQGAHLTSENVETLMASPVIGPMMRAAREWGRSTGEPPTVPECLRSAAALAAPTAKGGTEDRAAGLIAKLARASERLHENPIPGMIDGDLYVAVKNEGQGTGWRYVCSGALVSDLDEARALAYPPPPAGAAGGSSGDLADKALEQARHQRDLMFETLHKVGVGIGVLNGSVACNGPQLIAAMEAYCDCLASDSTPDLGAQGLKLALKIVFEELSAFSEMEPENGEDWQSWYCAAFDMASAAIYEKTKSLCCSVADRAMPTKNSHRNFDLGAKAPDLGAQGELAAIFPLGAGSGTYFRRLPDNTWVYLNHAGEWQGCATPRWPEVFGQAPTPPSGVETIRQDNTSGGK